MSALTKPNWWGVLTTIITSTLCALVGRTPSIAAAPELCPVPGLPAGFGMCLSVARLEDGWAAVSEDALLIGIGIGGTPTLLSPPSKAAFRVAASIPGGVVIAGHGVSYLYRSGHWVDLDLKDRIWFVESEGEGAILAGNNGIYYVDKSAKPRLLKQLKSPHPPHLHRIDGKLLVFAGRDGIFSVERHTLKDVTSQFPLGGVFQVASIHQVSHRRGYIAGTSRGIYSVQDGNWTPLCESHWKEHLGGLLLNAAVFGDVLVVTSYHGGIVAYTAQSCDELWRITPNSTYGNPTSVTAIENGLIISTTTGVFVLPDPTQLTFSNLPAGEITMLEKFEGHDAILGLSSGTFTLGSKIEKRATFLHSAALLADGRLVEGHFGKILIDGKEIKIGGRDVSAIAPVDTNSVAVIQPHGAGIVSADGRVTALPLSSPPNSIAVTASEILVGTETCAEVFSYSGSFVRKIGTKTSRVFQLERDAIVFELGGSIRNSDGRVVGATPGVDILDCILWRGQYTAIVRYKHGYRMIAVFNATQSSWTPLDLPLPRPPAALLQEGNDLLVFASGTVLRVHSAPTLGPPDISQLGLRMSDGSAITATDISLPSDEDGLEIRLPTSRLAPWQLPKLAVLLNGAEIESAGGRPYVNIQRLPRGRSIIEIKSEWADSSRTALLHVRRQWPWWGRAPAVVLYVLGLIAAVYGILRLRTHRLERRAAHLQEVVETRTAELRTAQKAREEFFSTLSHEIRNPLNGVVGLCQILNRVDGASDPERQRTLLRTLQGCSDQLRSIIDDVLDFTRIDRGEIQLHAEPFELNTAVEQATRAADAELSRCHIGRTPDAVWVLGDQGKLRQIVTNLVSNALKYGVPPEARIQTHCTHMPDGRVALSISVINTGPIIPKEELEMIFSGFVRGSGATQRRIQGTGLGLAVSRRIAEAMGGKLNVRSENQRTGFELQLVLPTAEPQAQSTTASSPIHPRRVLAVEDEPYNRLVLQHILNDIGCTTDWAADGAAALERIRENSYDLILTDLALPDITGFELARQIRLTAKQPIPPIIAVTAYCTPDKLRQAQDAGILSVVTKPISAAKLSGVLAEVV